jgi:hypothetical protein
MIKTNKKSVWYTAVILIIFLIGAFFRFYGINWDQGTHQHPDERMLIMVVERIEFPLQLNPDFFNYGSLPIYLLAAMAQLIDGIFGLNIDTYNGLLFLGRFVSTFVDLSTVLVVGVIARLLFSKKVVLMAIALYAFSFFPIQNSNFFIVDTLLALVLSLLFLVLLKYVSGPTSQLSLVLGTLFGIALAIKVTPIIYLPIIFLILAMRVSNSRLSFIGLRYWLIYLAVFGISAVSAHALCMPYAYLDWQRFISDTTAQVRMNSDAYVFPYTLQYVGTLPYIYYLKNIALWGAGPLVFGLFLIGLVHFCTDQVKRIRLHRIGTNTLAVFYVLFNFYAFLILGRSAVKFMRYLLPLYPFISIIGAYGLIQLTNRFKNKNAERIILVSVCILAMMWVSGFLVIYSRPHTRIQASTWMRNTIPPNSVIAVEHWDDRLPIGIGLRADYEELELYNLPDDSRKWNVINNQLSRADYIVLASNRLYTPLQKLGDCTHYKKCYPLTSAYYADLFREQFGFIKVAEFSSYPTWPILGSLVDDAADESFTVYDHPKVIIFKKAKV